MSRMTSAPAGLQYLVINLDGTYGRFPILAMSADSDNWAFFDTDGLPMDENIILYTGSLVTTPFGPTFDSLEEFERLTGLLPSASLSESEARGWVSDWIRAYD